MPNITEAHVVLLKQPDAQAAAVNADEDFTPWENFLAKARNIRPQRFQVHLVVAGFGEREEARQFAENFMAHGSIFVFSQKRRPLYRLEVEDNQAGGKNDKD